MVARHLLLGQPPAGRRSPMPPAGALTFEGASLSIMTRVSSVRLPLRVRLTMGPDLGAEGAAR